MAQARIVVRDEVLERGEQLLKTTKLGSLTELFNVLICRYGNHLESTWVIPAGCLGGSSANTQEKTVLETTQNSQGLDIDLDEPITGI